MTWFLGDVGTLICAYLVFLGGGLRYVDDGDGGDGDVSSLSHLSHFNLFCSLLFF